MKSTNMKCFFQMMVTGCLALWFPVFLLAQTNSVQDWPQFRGPTGMGHASATDLPTEFGDDKNLTWKVALPGRAWSSPVLVDDEIWVTTAIEHEASGEELEKKMEDADISGMSAYSSVELKAIRLNRQSGEIEATIDLFTVADPPLIHSLNSFASPTPVCDKQRVYVHFGTFGSAAIDRQNNQVVWKTQDYQLEHQTGPGSSPLLHNGLLVLHCDGCDLQYVVALDAENGKEVWRTDRSGQLHENPMMKKAFSTPVVVQRGRGEQLISAGANWLYGYDPDTGEELWKVSYGQLGFSNVARPIVMGDMVYVCTCFGQSKLMAIDLSGDQPVTDEQVTWSYSKQVPNMPSPIEVDGAIYFVNDRGIITCLDAATGEENWQGRLGGGFSSSPMYADGKIFVANHDGELFVLEANASEMNLLATNKLDSQIMASPAATGRSLIVRSANSLYKFELAR